MTIEQFIHNIISVESTDTFKNPYQSSVQSNNLFVYLAYMVEAKPEVLLVGEAPGYKGCALTGIPFTDEYRLTANGNVGCKPLLAPGYTIDPQNTESPHKEISAGVMWSAFIANSFFPMLWNIFPFHPHESGTPSSNRTPTQQEREKYAHIVSDLQTLLSSISRVYAVGKTAHHVLVSQGICGANDYIRHPANGGATMCREQVDVIANAYNTQL